MQKTLCNYLTVHYISILHDVFICSVFMVEYCNRQRLHIQKGWFVHVASNSRHHITSFFFAFSTFKIRKYIVFFLMQLRIAKPKPSKFVIIL